MAKDLQLIITVVIVYFIIFWSKLTTHLMARREELTLCSTIGERMKGPLKLDDKMVINYVRTQILSPPSPLKYNLSQKPIYKVYSKDLTWPFNHKKLQKLFLDQPPGFFVEAGALDGEMLSNTLWLEMEKGWRGLLVEPNGVSFASLLQKRRKAWTAHSCLATTPYPKMSTFSSYASAGKKSNFNKDYDWFLQSHTFDYDGGLNIGNADPAQRVFNTVHCFPLETFLIAVNVSVIDFFSLDIQGGEWDILREFPWTRVKLRTISVEYLKATDRRGVLNQDFINFMRDKNYTLIGTSAEPDYFFVANDDILLKKVL